MEGQTPTVDQAPNTKVCREKFQDEDHFNSLDADGKVAYLFESLHYVRRELRSASMRAEALIDHKHGPDGETLVSLHQALRRDWGG